MPARCTTASTPASSGAQSTVSRKSDTATTSTLGGNAAEPGRRVCLLLIDFYRYDKATQRLASQARRQGVDVVIFTDTFCSWARDITDKVFALPTSTGLFWHSTAAFSVLLNILVNDVIERLGERVEKRIGKVLQAQKLFDQYAEDV